MAETILVFVSGSSQADRKPVATAVQPEASPHQAAQNTHSSVATEPFLTCSQQQPRGRWRCGASIKLGRLFSGNSSKPHAKASVSVSSCLRRIAPEVTALKRGFCFSWGNALSPEVSKQVCLQPAAGLGSVAPCISPRDRDLAVMRGEGSESSANKRAQE